MTERASDYDFRLDSGRLCLDFAATVGSRGLAPLERWRNAQDLARWLAEAGLPSPPGSIGEVELRAARALREAVYRTVQARLGGSAPAREDVALINARAAAPPPAPRLDERARTVALAGEAPFEAALSSVARDAADLVTGPDLARVRECAEHSCTILFVDTSRPGTRRWCSMNRCGNKLKKAAWRRKRAGT